MITEKNTANAIDARVIRDLRLFLQIFLQANLNNTYFTLFMFCKLKKESLIGISNFI